MFGKPYHAMPTSSWMIPGGNRERKRALIKAQRYPTKSVIQKNLGGPLSEVFFSCLTASQKDNIGYTPKLQGPGQDLWVSPSDILIGKIRLTPPFTIRAQKALTHKTILELGADIEAIVYKKYQLDQEENLRKKELEMQLKFEELINEALLRDRDEQYTIFRNMMEQSCSDVAKSYQKTMDEALVKLQEENKKMMEEAVETTEREMEQELCKAVNSRSDYLGQQYQFQLAFRESSLVEKYENKIKKLHQEYAACMDKAQKQYIVNLKKIVVQLEAEHVTDLMLQASQKSKKYHEETKDLQFSFEDWFSNFFDTETAKRDFAIVELEDGIKKLKAKCEKEVDRLREVFRHFQKFINFALKEKPGQAEFLLSLEKELKEGIAKEKSEKDVDFMARIIIEYVMKHVEDRTENAAPQQVPKEHNKHDGYTMNNFRENIQNTKMISRKIKLVGEASARSLNEDDFVENEAKSLSKMFKNNPSMQLRLQGLHV